MHGRYSIIRKFAEGGMAEIFLAELEGRQGFKKRVVLKCIRTALYADPAFRQMLVDEALISTRLTHSNIVQVLDLGEAQGRYFLALELVDGWSLDQLIRRSRATGHALPAELTLFIVAETCRALAFAHGLSNGGEPLGVVHRDISPQNILISEHGDVKLADFGIAKALTQDDSTKTAAGVVKGKLAFMSPEQARAAPIDARSDLFSLGTVLYLLMTGNLPFQAPTAIETLVRVQSAEFPAPEKVRSGIPKDVLRILHKAMKGRPEERYQSADEMMNDLERVMRQLRPVGQTELRRWLSELTAKDGILPISQQDVKESAVDPALSGPVELSSASNLVSAPLPKTRPSRTTGSLAEKGASKGAAKDATKEPPKEAQKEAAPTAPRTRTPARPMPAVKARTGASPATKKRRSLSWLALPFATLMVGGGFALYRELSLRTPSWKELPALAPEKSTLSRTRMETPEAEERLVLSPSSSHPSYDDVVTSASVPPVLTADAGLDAPLVSEPPPAAAGHSPGPVPHALDAGTQGWEAPLDSAPAVAPPALAPTAANAEAPSVSSPEESPTPTAPALTADAGVTAEPAPPDDDLTDKEEQRLLATAPTNVEAVVLSEAESVERSPAKPAAASASDERSRDGRMRSNPSETVSVYVQSQPPGAVVQLHNRVFGKTPIPLRFKPGMSFELTFLKAGYQRASKKFFVHERAGQKVTAYLKKAPEKKESAAK